MGGPAARLTVVELAQLSDTGRVRHHNEDRLLARPPLIAVADGMGGAQAGEVAAQIAVDALAELAAPVAADDLRGAIERANGEIRASAARNPETAGMGTTLTAAMLDEDRLEVLHVGDSRAYLWRDGGLRRLTDDHSVVAEMVRRGSLSEEEAEVHPHRNVITRALGAEPDVVTDHHSEELHAGDVVLICSDGLSSYVPEREIAAALGAGEGLARAARRLVDAANRAGGADNVTVVLARVDHPPGEREGGTARAPAPQGVAGGGPLPRSGVLEPAGRRRRTRLRPTVAAVVVVLCLVAGAVAWIASRSYVIERTPSGGLRVAHGLGFDVAGINLARPWQDIPVSAAAVEAADPGALDGHTGGQGEVVAQAVDLIWRFGLPRVPALAVPPSARTTTRSGGP